MTDPAMAAMNSARTSECRALSDFPLPAAPIALMVMIAAEDDTSTRNEKASSALTKTPMAPGRIRLMVW